ncbi:hypothetical protein AGOR_G00148550 [Albula goreensis]|uniref:Uncharacterized protein n=1 Tax=Albula goreensis TaxID=1534307 RepID=A0A8T3D8G2_9TELE|nr:hypothetical protein AGOR_G00148550 [Albula goreensis]
MCLYMKYQPHNCQALLFRSNFPNLLQGLSGGEQQQVPHCGLQESTGASPQCHALPPVCPLSSWGPGFTRPDISPCAVPSEHAWSRTSAAPSAHAPLTITHGPEPCSQHSCAPPESDLRYQHPHVTSPPLVPLQLPAVECRPQNSAQCCCQFLCDAIKQQSSSRTGNRRGVLMGLHLSESLETQGRKGRQDNPSCSLGVKNEEWFHWGSRRHLTL